VRPALFRRLALLALLLSALIVLTGAAVRLSGSGLGCSDWPTCTAGHLTPRLHFHGLVEFSNRVVTVVLTVAVALALIGAALRVPFRRDLVWLAAALVGLVLGQAVLGGIVVYTKLNPYVVMPHLLLSLLEVAVAVVLLHRCTRDYGPASGRLLVPRPLLHLGRGQLALLAIVLAAGTATTGAGPHAGESSGQLVARRLPVPLRDMAELHSTLAILLIGLCIGLAVALHAVETPERVRKAGRILVVVLLAQAAVGYAQYFTHLPVVLVEIHIAGATALVVGSVQFFLSLTSHPPEPPAEEGPKTASPSQTEPARAASPAGVR
jgi:cytochrome c oxidase assembly protein subunit 15